MAEIYHGFLCSVNCIVERKLNLPARDKESGTVNESISLGFRNGVKGEKWEDSTFRGGSKTPPLVVVLRLPSLELRGRIRILLNSSSLNENTGLSTPFCSTSTRVDISEVTKFSVELVLTSPSSTEPLLRTVICFRTCLVPLSAMLTWLGWMDSGRLTFSCVGLDGVRLKGGTGRSWSTWEFPFGR